MPHAQASCRMRAGSAVMELGPSLKRRRRKRSRASPICQMLDTGIGSATPVLLHTLRVMTLLLLVNALLSASSCVSFSILSMRSTTLESSSELTLWTASANGVTSGFPPLTTPIDEARCSSSSSRSMQDAASLWIA